MRTADGRTHCNNSHIRRIVNITRISHGSYGGRLQQRTGELKANDLANNNRLLSVQEWVVVVAAAAMDSFW